MTPKIFDGKLKLYEYALAPSYPGQMYIVILDPVLFNNINAMSMAVHSNDSSFIYDTSFSSNILHKMEQLPIIDIYHRELLRMKLEYPYDTNCRNPPNGYSTWYEFFLRKVDSAAIQLFNYSIPFAPTFNSSSNARKLLNYRAFFNETLRKELSDLMDKLFKRRSSCKHMYFITTTETTFKNESGFTVHWTHDEKTIVLYSPEQELIDYIVYLCSSVGIWFGLSAYSFLDSFQIWMSNRKVSNAESSGSEQLADDISVLKKRSLMQNVDMKIIKRQNRFLREKVDLIQKFNEQLVEIIKSQ